MKKNICILYPGGTIGMVDSPDGLKPKENFLKDYLANLAELKQNSMPNYSLIEFDKLID